MTERQVDQERQSGEERRCLCVEGLVWATKLAGVSVVLVGSCRVCVFVSVCVCHVSNLCI